MVDETQIETMTIRLFDECEGGDGTEETRVHLANQREFPPIHIVSGRMKGFPAIRLMATAGVALRPNRVEMKDGSVREVPVELVLAIRDERIDTLAHLAYACALDGGTVRPGIVFKNTVELPGSELKHCFLAEPFMWDDGAVFSRGYTLEGGRNGYCGCRPCRLRIGSWNTSWNGASTTSARRWNGRIRT